MFFLGALSGYFLLRNRKAAAVISSLFLVLYTSLVTMTPVPRMLINHWEAQSPAVLHPTKLKAAIVLTGGIVNYMPELDQFDWQLGADRFFEAIRLYRRGLIGKIIITGGRPFPIKGRLGETESMLMYAGEIGIPASDLISENKSLNTYENAVNLAKLPVMVNYMKDVYLITSAFHMPRSMKVFERVGYKPVAFPVGFHSDDEGKSPGWNEGGLENLSAFRTYLREWVGLTVYEWTDRAN
jgi:uncharacterized SAM-binding protein YcdF (DUF218 family)